MEKSRLQLSQLCQSFAQLFQKLKENKQHKLELERLNQQLTNELEIEKTNRLQTEDILNKERNDLTYQMKQIQEILESFQLSEVQLDEAISQSTNQQRLLQNEKFDLEEILKMREKGILEKTQQHSFLQEEVNFLCKQMNLLNENEKSFENTILNVEGSIDTHKIRLSDILLKIEEAEKLCMELSQERDINEQQLRQIQKELSNTIKLNSCTTQKIKDSSKNLDKLSQQLHSKIDRLKTQYKHNTQLNLQLKKLEQLRNSQQKCEQQFQQEDSEYNLNTPMKSEVQNGGGVSSEVLSKSVSPRSSNNKLSINKTPTMTEEQKVRINEYKQYLIQQLEVQKMEIVNFDEHVNSLQSDIEYLQSQFEQYTFIPQDQLKKLFEQHFLSINPHQNPEQQNVSSSEYQDNNNFQQNYNPNEQQGNLMKFNNYNSIHHEDRDDQNNYYQEPLENIYIHPQQQYQHQEQDQLQKKQQQQQQYQQLQQQQQQKQQQVNQNNQQSIAINLKQHHTEEEEEEEEEII